MGYQTLVCMLLLPVLSFFSASLVVSTFSIPSQEFIGCLSTNISSDHLYTQTSPQFKSLFEFKQQNTRWLNTFNSTSPLLILTPYNESEIRTAIVCSKSHGLQLRVRSGGHDYEGLSFRAQTGYIIVDLVQFRRVDVDVTQETAWVQAGATLGEMYYAIAAKSPRHAFPGGTCPSVGTTGLISGGGFGMLVRKFGLAADNVLDGRLMNVEGQVLDKQTMGEDVFWAIRGGGAASFGVITAWKLRLVRIPETITAFNKHMIVDESVNTIIHRWQTVAPNLPNDLLIRVVTLVVHKGGERHVQADFNGNFLGSKWKLLQVMNEKFPLLGLVDTDCHEMPWVNSTTLYFKGENGSENPLEMLLNRSDKLRASFKAKSDFVSEPIPENALRGIWDRLMKTHEFAVLLMEPFGGRMNEISKSHLPFPYRHGFIYNFQYLIKWIGNNSTAANASMEWMTELYKYMEPYVSKSPRAAYINYRDLDIGTNWPDGNTSFSQARRWGEKYFRANFQKLAQIKGRVDPENFFRNEQSIPPWSSEALGINGLNHHRLCISVMVFLYYQWTPC